MGGLRFLHLNSSAATRSGSLSEFRAECRSISESLSAKSPPGNAVTKVRLSGMETLQLRGRWTGGIPGLGLTLSELFPLNLPPAYATVTGVASHPG